VRLPGSDGFCFSVTPDLIRGPAGERLRAEGLFFTWRIRNRSLPRLQTQALLDAAGFDGAALVWIKSGMTVGEQRTERPYLRNPAESAPARKSSPGCGRIQSGGPHAGSASGVCMVGAGSLPVPHRGGAVRARPGTRRMLSGIRQAAPRISRGILGPARIAPAAIRTDRGTCFWHGFRHGP
jgi:hypothetical protein